MMNPQDNRFQKIGSILALILAIGFYSQGHWIIGTIFLLDII